MSNFRDTVKKAVGNSAIFNKTADFLSDKQKKFKAEQALEVAKAKLDALYRELGQTAYKKRPLTAGRTQAVIRDEITATILEVENLQNAYNDLFAPTNVEASSNEETPTSEEVTSPETSDSEDSN